MTGNGFRGQDKSRDACVVVRSLSARLSLPMMVYHKETTAVENGHSLVRPTSHASPGVASVWSSAEKGPDDGSLDPGSQDLSCKTARRDT